MNTNNLPKVLLLPCLVAIFCFCSGFLVIGHRGDPVKAPEETFASFDSAFKDGADVIELDLQLSKDNVLIISHDANIGRITGHSVNISDATFAELSQYKQANGEPIHSLNELFEHYKNKPKVKYLIETKRKSNNTDMMEQQLAAVIKSYKVQKQCVVQSFQAASLKALSLYLPKVPRYYIVSKPTKINFFTLTYVDGINLWVDVMGTSLIPEMHRMNKKVLVWSEMTEKTTMLNTLVNQTIDGLVTNYPAVGRKYANLKSEAKYQPIDKWATLTDLNGAPTFLNPYVPDQKGKSARPLASFFIHNGINIDGRIYYQIGENQYVDDSYLNIGDKSLASLVYVGKKFKVTGQNLFVDLYSSPFEQQPMHSSAQVLSGTTQTITATKYIGNDLWLRIDDGWLPASEGQFIFPTQTTDMAYQFNQLIKKSLRQVNIQLADGWFKNQTQIKIVTFKHHYVNGLDQNMVFSIIQKPFDLNRISER